MTSLYIVVSIVVVGVGVLLHISGKFSGSTVDLGTVSHGWLAEQRLGRKDDMR